MTIGVPWLLLLLAIPLIGAAVAAVRPERARESALIGGALAFAGSLGALWASAAVPFYVDPWDPGRLLLGRPMFVLDAASAVLLVFAATLVLFIAVVAPMRKWRTGTAVRILSTETLLFGAFLAHTHATFVFFWIASNIPLNLAMRASGRGSECCRAFRLSSIIGSAIMAAGAALLIIDTDGGHGLRLAGAVLVMVAALIRQGIFPFHSWLPHLFENAPLPAALLYFIPQWGTWAFLRMIYPIAPPWMLSVLGAASSFTALYGAGIALVETDARRAFGWLCLSELALVFASLEGSSATGLAGGLLMALSSGLSLTGLGMALAALEARRGRLLLDRYSGGYDSTPRLAAGFLLLGLCSVGFPGTLGFVGADLLVDGTVLARPQLGVVLVISTVLSGLAVVRMYFRLFCGRHMEERPQISLRQREHFGFLAIVLVLTLLGLMPQRLLAGRLAAATAALEARNATVTAAPTHGTE